MLKFRQLGESQYASTGNPPAWVPSQQNFQEFILFKLFPPFLFRLKKRSLKL